MGYSTVERVLNQTDMLKAAYQRVEEKKIIDKKVYTILLGGLIENYLPEDPDPEEVGKDILQVVLKDNATGEQSTRNIELEAELGLSPKTVYNYYLYRFTPRNIVRGTAIRVVRPKQSEDDPDWFAYNAVVVQSDVRQIAFIMVPSRGPMHRILTARQCYENHITVYVYTEPDLEGYADDSGEEHYVPLT